MAKHKFPKNSFMMLDRSSIDLGGAEFEVTKIDDLTAEIKLTPKGIRKVKKTIEEDVGNDQSRQYLKEFLEDDLEGNLEFVSYEGEDRWGVEMEKMENGEPFYDWIWWKEEGRK